MLKISLNKSELNRIDFNWYIGRYPQKTVKHLQDPAGHEPYRLYAHLVQYFSGIKIADIGSRFGTSAMALSFNQTNWVQSFDVNEEYIADLKENVIKSNVSFYHQDVLTDKKILGYPLIILDVDPHDTIQEERCFEFLRKNQYQGIVILDDIAEEYWPIMNVWWENIPEKKWNLTAYGHASGTGLVDFGNTLDLELL